MDCTLWMRAENISQSFHFFDIVLIHLQTFLSGFWKATSASCSSPLLVLVNSKSGDNQGVKFLRKFKQLLNPAQVFDLMNGGPELGCVDFIVQDLTTAVLRMWVLMLYGGSVFVPFNTLCFLAFSRLPFPLPPPPSACAFSRSLWRFVSWCVEETAAWAGCSLSWINSTCINRWVQRGGGGRGRHDVIKVVQRGMFYSNTT